MVGFAEGYFIIFGGLALLGAIAAVYFYLQDRKEAQMEEKLIPLSASFAAQHSLRPFTPFSLQNFKLDRTLYQHFRCNSS